MSTALQPVRPLSFLEKYFTTRHFLGLDACVVSSARYTFPPGQAVTEKLLISALRTVINSHGELGLRLHGKEDTPDLTFVKLPNIDLSRVVVFTTDLERDLQTALEWHLSTPLENTQADLPLWRLEVLPDNTIILAAHHAILDGLSHAAFHTALLEALNTSLSLGVHSDSDSGPVAEIPEVFLPRTLEELVDIRPSLYNIANAFYELLVPKSWQPGFTAWTGRPVPATPTLKTQVRLLSLSPSDAARLADSCRTHKATINSALYALSVSTLATLLTSTSTLPPQHSLAKYKTVSILTPLSARPLLNISPTAFGNYITSHHTFPALNPTFSWDLATRFASELKAQRGSTTGYGALGIMRMAEKQYVKFFKGTLGKKRRFGVALSNLGRVDPSVHSVLKGNSGDEQQCGIEEMFFSPCDPVMGAALGISVVGDPRGGLNIVFKWGVDSLHTQFVEKFVEEFRAALLAL
ncbi:alcohol acetyltransferase [Favolaschia claudopus]|uniref:Alcohol acetyltransferase n=1 Tax=Favolaschia claudopus TaxID=2862362 RepID=A0AAW0DHA8_9AGAR